MSETLSITVVEADPQRAELIVEGLRELGDHEIRVVSEAADLARRIAEQAPDIVLVDIADPSRDAIEELTVATGPQERPVAMFVDQTDEALTRAAVEAGVSAYVVNGLAADRVKPVLDAAVARFNMMRRLRTELAETKRALEERKLIDRAKGLLMKARGIEEEEAYSLLRHTAMDQGRRIADIAEALVTTAGLLR